MTNESDVGVDAVDRPEPYDAMPAEADGEADTHENSQVVNPGVNLDIVNDTAWAVLCPTDAGRWAWVEDGGRVSLFSSIDKARVVAGSIQGSVVYPVRVGISGPGVQRVG